MLLSRRHRITEEGGGGRPLVSLGRDPGVLWGGKRGRCRVGKERERGEGEGEGGGLVGKVVREICM